MNKVNLLIGKFGTFVNDHEVSLTNAFLALCTLGAEQVVETVAFNCPCARSDAENLVFKPKIRGYLYLLLPAGVIFFICMIASNKFWRICQGCYKIEAKFKDIWCDVLAVLSDVTGRAILISMSWVITALMDGDFYVCMKSGTDIPQPTQESPRTESYNLVTCYQKGTAEYEILKSESQIWAWIVLFLLIGISSIFSCCVRCCQPSSYKLLKFQKMYQDTERKYYKQKTEVLANEIAEQAVDRFITDGTNEKMDWDTISLPNSLCLDQGKITYSALHKWYIKKIAEPRN